MAEYPKPKPSGRTRVYEGSKLREIAFPLGGVGTGTVSLGGRGDLRDWEIFNAPNKGALLPYTFPALWVEGDARVLEARPWPPYTGAHGLERLTALGLPRLEASRFIGEYPFAWVEFIDPRLPLEASLEAFNPMIPLNPRDSGLPVAVLTYRLENRSSKPLSATLCLSLCNAIGWGRGVHVLRPWPGFGGNLNRFIDEGGFRGIKMTSERYAEDDPRYGSMALATRWRGVTYTERWTRGEWWDDITLFWQDFAGDGRLENLGDGIPSPEGRTDIASLGAVVHLEPGEEAKITFAIAWHFPNRLNLWDREPPYRGALLRNWYATQWRDAWEVLRYLFDEFERLRGETALFHRALFSSTLPEEVLDAASSQMSTLRTNTCMRLEDGSFHAFEGCNDTVGCCPMNCTHVWNYEQALAHLYPSLERSMRRTDFLVNTEADGKMAFRTRLPSTIYKPWLRPPAADGQMGCLVKLYREWRLSGDDEFLKELWPHAKRALEYAWRRWDLDRDGVMETDQHNTYDIEFHGPNTMVGTIYLAALKAAEEMARHLGDPSAEEYRRLYDSGVRKLDEMLWNGEYYIQLYDPEKAPKYQYGEGCLSDQLLGEWMARAAGLGRLLPEEHVREALRSIHRYNWRRDFYDHENPQRVYAVNDDRGLLLCTWPRGGRPRIPFVYCDEVWSGVEYQVASHLIYEDLVDEALEIVRGVRDRHDGERRNPWNEFECGHHYARAMASWTLLLALSGYEYSAPEGHLGFDPRISRGSFRCLYTTGTGWGVFSQTLSAEERLAVVEVLWGSVSLGSLGLGWGDLEELERVGARLGGRPIEARVERGDEGLRIVFEEPVEIKPGRPLIVYA